MPGRVKSLTANKRGRRAAATRIAGAVGEHDLGVCRRLGAWEIKRKRAKCGVARVIPLTDLVRFRLILDRSAVVKSAGPG